jgi:hypothetical protein
MSKVKTIEFWLFALAALFVVAVFLSVFDKMSFDGRVFLILVVAWMVLAVAWMFKEIVRRVRG